MAKHTASTLMAGHAPSSLQKTQNNGGHSHRRKNKNNKMMKSNITNQVKSRRANVMSVGDVESDDDDDGDGFSADEAASNDDDDDADVSALSGAQQEIGSAAERLAGHDDDEDRRMVDTNVDEVQATVGASVEDFVFDDDEDDYAGVEDISDSEDEVPGAGKKSMLRAAEEDLIAEFRNAESQRVANHLFLEMDVNMDLEGAEDAALSLGLLDPAAGYDDDRFQPINMNEDPFHGHPLHGDEYQNMWGNAESALWRMPDTVRNRQDSDPANVTQKRVRFEEARLRTKSPSPSASEDEDPNDAFPDLFTPENSQMNQGAFGIVSDGVFPSEDFNDNESFYDFDGEEDKLAFDQESDDSDSDASSYDSDDSGDTTDEETMEETMAKEEEREQAALEAMKIVQDEEKQAERSKPTTPKTPKTPRNRSTPLSATPGTGRGPKMGSFKANPSRAAITTDIEGGKIKIQPPSQPSEKDREYWERAKSAISSREGSPRNSFQIVRSVSSDSMPVRPFTAQSTLRSMFNGNLDILRNNDVNGIAEMVFPEVMNGPQSSYSSFEGTDDLNTQQNDEMIMQDLVNMDDSESDAGMHSSSAITSPITPWAGSSFQRRGSGDLFNHFELNRASVGAFRQNQNWVKQFSSQASHPAQRASTHEFNALQKGRRGAANTPITPARKQRASQDLSAAGRSSGGVRKAVNSPLTHKRSRSRGNSLAHADLQQTIGRNPFDS